VKCEILIVGRGGQGVLLMGRVIGLAASKYAGLYSVVTESYAAEIRGGESRADVVVASSMEEIPYVKVTSPDITIFMYPYRIDQYKALLGGHTIVILDEEYVDPSLFQGYRLVSSRFSEIAERKLNTRRVANIIILGKMLRYVNLLTIEHVKRAIEELVPRGWLDVNFKALEIGYSL